MIWVNSENVRHLPTPFGGVKNSRHRPRRRRLVVRFLHGDQEHRLRHRQPTRSRNSAAEAEPISRPRRETMPIPAQPLSRPSTSCGSAMSNSRVTDLAESRAFYVDTLGLQVTDEDSRRASICGRWRSAAITASCCARRRGRLPRPRLQGLSRGGPRQGRSISSRAGTCRSNGSSGPTRRRTFRTRDPHGIPLEFYAQMDRLPPIHQQYALYQRREAAAHRPLQLLLAECRRVGRLLQRDRLPRDRIHRGRGDRPALGGVDAPQGRRPRHRLHQRRAARACTTPPSGCRRRSTSSTCST